MTIRPAQRLTDTDQMPIFAIVADSSIANLPIITLTTDFGLDDWYVAVMKAVLLGYSPAARLTDVTHTIPPGDVLKGSITLERAIDAFPPGTVHLAVVDPGVGSSRRGIVARFGQQLVVCPDNGLITWAWHRKGKAEVSQITWRPPECSNTFHGRDIFAPVAGMLAAGRAVGDLAKTVTDPTLLPLQPASGHTGHIIHIDRFGNATTNIPASAVAPNAQVGVGELTLLIRRTYCDVPPGQPLALIGSSDLLEIAVRDGPAATNYNLAPGAPVTIMQTGV